MQWVIEDSEVAALAVLQAAAQCELRLSAARVLAPGEGTGSGQGQWQPLLLTLQGAQLLGDTRPSEVAGRIQQGCVRVDGLRMHRLPLPCTLTADAQAPLVLELEMAWGTLCRIQALGLALQAPPQAGAVDALQC